MRIVKRSNLAKRARSQDGLTHAVDDFFIGWADRGEYAAELGLCSVPVSVYEIVRAKPDAALHGLRLAKREVEPFCIHPGRLVVALQNPR